MYKIPIILISAVAVQNPEDDNYFVESDLDDYKTFDPIGIYIGGGLVSTALLSMMAWTINETHKNSKKLAVLFNEIESMKTINDIEKEQMKMYVEHKIKEKRD